MIQTLVTFEQDGHTIEYVPPYLTRDIYLISVDIFARDWTGREGAQALALAEWCAKFCKDQTAKTLVNDHYSRIYALAVHMVKSCGFKPETKTNLGSILNVWSGGDEYDPAKDVPSCTCVKCMGVGDDDSLCKYAGVDKSVMEILEWSHLAKHPQYLDAPYTLYTIARLKAMAEGNGEAARRQKREDEKKSHGEAKKTRAKYGHNW